MFFQHSFKKIALVITLLLVFIIFAMPVFSQQPETIRLSNNRGVTSSIWKIEGEPTVVINGFDLTPTTLRLPVLIESITIDVFRPVQNQLVDALVYADQNGGSPADAELVGAAQFVIRNDGVFVAQFERPIVVNAPVVWVGFNMPVDMEFRADKQGPSVLTYWAWAPGATFNLRDLSSAPILGPSDGSGPVNLNLGGVARITAFARSGNDVIPLDELNTAGDLGEITPEQATDYLTNYTSCPQVFYDTGDLDISIRNTYRPSCTEVESWRAPAAPAGYRLSENNRFFLYDITFYDDDGNPLKDALPIAVTHCFAPPAGELEAGIIAVAYGAPRRWDLLQTQVIENLICAEVNRGGNLIYFLPTS